jgi:phage pi2 protein 07
MARTSLSGVVNTPGCKVVFATGYPEFRTETWNFKKIEIEETVSNALESILRAGSRDD